MSCMLGNGKKPWHWRALPRTAADDLPCAVQVPRTDHDVHILPCAVQVPCTDYRVAGVAIFGKYYIMGFKDCKKRWREEWRQKLVYYLKNILILFRGKNWSWRRSFPFLRYLCLRYVVNIIWSGLYGIIQQIQCICNYGRITYLEFFVVANIVSYLPFCW